MNNVACGGLVAVEVPITPSCAIRNPFSRHAAHYGLQRGKVNASFRHLSGITGGNDGGSIQAYTGIVKFRIVLEFDRVVQSFAASCPELPGCASAADTEEEARRNIKEAIDLYLAPSAIEVPENAKLTEVTIG